MAGVRRVQALVSLLVLTLAPVGATVAARPACAAAANHAALIVDTGSGSAHTYCVGFDGDSISGKDVLDLAHMDPPPVYRPYGGNGVAVCQLLGVGRDADHCLEAGANWAYYRGAAGASGFTYSNAGASSTVVHDGDVEGWVWETAPAPPPFRPASQVCAASSGGGPATTVPAGGVVSRSPGGGAPPTSTATTASGGTGGVSASASSTAPSDPTAAGPAGSTTTSAPPGDLKVAARRSTAKGSGGGGGSAWSLAVFGVMLAGLLAWLVWARRARLRRSS